MPDARRTLILDLSSKVTEQQAEIIRLREQLNRCRCADVDGAVAAESYSKCSDNDRLEHLDSQSSIAVSLDRHVVVEQSSTNSPLNRSRMPPIGRTTNSKNILSIGRGSREPVQSRSKNSSEPAEKNVGSYRAHWASSCFDVNDLTNDTADEDSAKAVDCDERDCAKINTDVGLTIASAAGSPSLSLHKSIRDNRKSTRSVTTVNQTR